PPEADRTRLPGFGVTWPKNEDFELLNNAFTEKYPDADQTTDDVSLMAVWVSLRLPMELEDEAETEPDAGDLPAEAAA
ncbi:MAG: hypothetical protein ACKOC5_19670, partial [Chloroflexota bacterium]